MSTRSFVCLLCGRSVSVSREEYDLLRENPICDTCRENGPSGVGHREESGGCFDAITQALGRGLAKFAPKEKESHKKSEDNQGNN